MWIPSAGLDYVANKAIPYDFDVALSNSFGFGGINATLIMEKVDGVKPVLQFCSS